MVEIALGSVVSLWLLFGLATGIILAIIVLVTVLFSRDPEQGHNDDDQRGHPYRSRG